MKPCPLCGELLKKGQRVHTVVYSTSAGGKSAARQNRIQDSMVHMFGCPFCYPGNDQYPRRCPVCNNIIPKDGYVIARMFEKKPKNHVHVLGCTVCKSGAKRRTGSGA